MSDIPKTRTLGVTTYEQTEAQWAVDPTIHSTNVMLVPIDGDDKGKHKLGDGIHTYAQLGFVDTSSGPGSGITSVNGDTGPAVQLDAEDIPVTPYIYINAGSGPGAYRNNGNTADGRIIWELAGGAGPADDAIVPSGGEWQLAVGGTVMYTSDNYPTDIQDVTGWTIANGLAPTPSISPDYGDDVQEQLEKLAVAALKKGEITFNGTHQQVSATVSAACDSNGRVEVNFTTASGGRPALTSAQFVGGCGGTGTTNCIVGRERDGALSAYSVQFFDVETVAPPEEGTLCTFTVIGTTA